MKILDCTLRDGSYAIDFQFSAHDTLRIASQLDDLGFPLIEVGHGIGLGASECDYGVAAATDEEYMRAAHRAVIRGQWGMFCIPGIATLSHLDMAAEYNMGFIRVGSDVEKAEETRPFIEKARKLGIFVFANLMKSYVSKPDYFASQAGKCIEYGAQCIYIVDSAGGMLPAEIGHYIEALPNVQLGFHGHNNIGMAVANSLYCMERGAAVIDTSLQGLGRSSGNTPTEQFIAAAIRAGYPMPFDVVDIMEAGEELVRPILRNRGFDSLDTVAGLALFHSSHTDRVIAAARKHRIDPRRLILALCKYDRVNAPDDLIEMAAREVKKNGD